MFQPSLSSPAYFNAMQQCILLDDAHVGFFVADGSGRILCANRLASRLLDHVAGEVALGRVALTDRWQHEPDFIARIFSELTKNGHWSGEIFLRHRDGVLRRRMLSLSATHDTQGELHEVLGLISDCTIDELPPQRARDIAHLDPLTGLPNRLLLNDRLDQAIAVNRRSGTLLAICFMDLDGFKQINDTLGHAAGDSLLRHVASRLQFSLRDSDTVARVGGDEFVMLLSGLGSEDECRLALTRLLRDISQPYTLDGGEQVEISLSVGVAIFPVDDAEPAILLQHADQAMYAAKRAGKNRFQMFDARLEERMQARQQMLSRVGRALTGKQFSLHYQPIVDIANGRTVGLEALIRWRHPVLGNLAPAEFIPLIEEDELARHLGNWVIEQALLQARAWHTAGIEIPVGVNIFARQLLSMDFPKTLRRIVEEIWPELPEGRLCFEIQEAANPLALPRMQESILACRDLGIHFVLDDFGIGPSSINSLRSLSLDAIKIHQSFAQEVPSTPSAKPIIRSIVDLAEAFGLLLVTEGVETEERARDLLALGCRIMQGFGIARPMPAAAVADWLAAGNAPCFEDRKK